jgi:hypothetical protein
MGEEDKYDLQRGYARDHCFAGRDAYTTIEKWLFMFRGHRLDLWRVGEKGRHVSEVVLLLIQERWLLMFRYQGELMIQAGIQVDRNIMM